MAEDANLHYRGVFHNEGIAQFGSGSINIGTAAVGRSANVSSSASFFADSLTELASEARGRSSEAAAILEWLKTSGLKPDEPADARERVSRLKAVGAWLWDRFVVVVDSSAASVGPWLVTLVHNVARWTT
jgi:hypothetical protein